MKIQFHIRGFNVSAGWRRWLEQSIEQLGRLFPVTGAAVVLECEREAAPAYRAFVLLAVAGPDLHAEARDHTLEAAWMKVTAALRKQIERRRSRQGSRRNRNGQLRAPILRRAHGTLALRS